MLEQKGFSKAQSYWVGIPSILESLYAEQIAQDRPLLSLSLGYTVPRLKPHCHVKEDNSQGSRD